MIRRFRLNETREPVVARMRGGGWEVDVGGESVRFRLELRGRGRGVAIFPDGRRLPVLFSRLGPGLWQLFLGGREHTVALEDPLEARGAAKRRHDGQEELKAPIPGRVVQVLVAPGAEVVPGTPVVVLEAMKMQNLIATQAGGRVREVRVQPGATVEAGQVLAVVG